jgi:hypothetical protein
VKRALYVFATRYPDLAWKAALTLGAGLIGAGFLLAGLPGIAALIVGCAAYAVAVVIAGTGEATR